MSEHTDTGTAAPARPAGWFSDPLDADLLRYWDGAGWTFYTRVPAASAPEPATAPAADAPPRPGLRADIEAAVRQVRGGLLGANKELRLLPDYLRTEERVVALCAGAHGGTGVLVATNQRLLFLFEGVVRRAFLEVGWNAARGVVYFTDTRQLAVFTTRRTKKAVPAFAVGVANRADAERVAAAAVVAANAPRLDGADFRPAPPAVCLLAKRSVANPTGRGKGRPGSRGPARRRTLRPGGVRPGGGCSCVVYVHVRRGATAGTRAATPSPGRRPPTRASPHARRQQSDARTLAPAGAGAGCALRC